jgi:hypothetical protein
VFCHGSRGNSAGHLTARRAATGRFYVPTSWPVACSSGARESSAVKKTIHLILLALVLMCTVTGCEDCQPCDDPSQLICPDEW